MKFLALAFFFVIAQAGGCSNPNAIGVQDYGSVTGRVLDAANNRPVPNALVSVGSLITGNADSQGAFTLSQIPIGLQTVTASAPGYRSAQATARVHKGQTATIYYVRIAPVSGGPTAEPPATPTPSPEPSEEPASPAPGASPSASPTPTP
ncbi:MAG: carboxypeptidase regulatory-like domain-containing protein [Candidatus Eremiobacteraeota bacterium]|nr:carboxypeptidase regulatory-like domain-containing protein [Candidatus Eremiobacteraeota bacterium]